MYKAIINNNLKDLDIQIGEKTLVKYSRNMKHIWVSTSDVHGETHLVDSFVVDDSYSINEFTDYIMRLETIENSKKRKKAVDFQPY